MVDAMRVVNFGRPVEAHSDAYGVALNDLQPGVLDERAVGLNHQPGQVLAQDGLRAVGEPVERAMSHQRRLAAVKTERHSMGASTSAILAYTHEELLEYGVAHHRRALAPALILPIVHVAIIAVQIASF